jgi:hypothetical protein
VRRWQRPELTPLVEKTSPDLLGSFRSDARPAQSLKVQICATSRKLAAAKSRSAPSFSAVTGRIEKAAPMSGDP